ncbi:hypothetical protein DL96DRAFT_1565804 [Flagelloscypha sp. PMI_526]|nr:hypothetical protein DL96DRAFT_1565804 [Flagelloscypha sp. PMI_526]
MLFVALSLLLFLKQCRLSMKLFRHLDEVGRMVGKEDSTNGSYLNDIQETYQSYVYRAWSKSGGGSWEKGTMGKSEWRSERVEPAIDSKVVLASIPGRILEKDRMEVVVVKDKGTCQGHERLSTEKNSEHEGRAVGGEGAVPFPS